MPRVFRDYNVNQPMLFGPNVREWLPENHPSHFISDVVEKLDLTEIYKSYEGKGLRGAPPIDPRLLLKIVFYGYSIGTRSSRRLEKATYEDVAASLSLHLCERNWNQKPGAIFIESER